MEATDRDRFITAVRKFYGPVTFNRLIGLVPTLRAGERLTPAEQVILSYLEQITGLRVDTEEAFVAVFDGLEEAQEPASWVRQGRILADTSRQRMTSAFALVTKFYYEDEPFTCVDCGSSEVWTAKQQQWWYEVAQGVLESKAIRCRQCRRAKRAGDGKQRPEAGK